MTEEQLRQQLQQFQQELADAEGLSEETVAGLRKLSEDIRTLVESRRANGDEGPPDAQQVRQQLETLQQFEVDHPQLARFIAQVTDLLGNMGF